MNEADPKWLLNYARQEGLDDHAIKAWFMWAIHNLMTVNDIKEEIKLKRRPIDHWRLKDANIR